MLDPYPVVTPPQPTAHPTTDRSRRRSSAATGSNTSAQCPSHNSDRDRDLDPDNLELHEIETQHDDYSTGSISSGEERNTTTTRRTISRTTQASSRSRRGILGRIARLWGRQVVLTVSHRRKRDYFALERTFLAYIRTSVILAMQGALIAQLFRLQAPSSTSALGYHEVGVPLSVTCHVAAIVTAVLGAHRFWKQQDAIAREKVYAGGWELNCIGGLTTAITLVTFVLSVFIAVTIE
ncbi:hypothetical protein BJX70DRAFT_400234 [Aspergillus crustosus]